MPWIESLSITFQVILYVCGSLAALAGGIAVIIKFWKWVRKPADEATAELDNYKGNAEEVHKALQMLIESNTTRIQNLENRVDKAYELLEKDLQRFKDNEQSNQILYRALWAILDHQLTGNNTEEMKKVRDQLLSYFIDH